MENDESAESFDVIACQSGQFGFFQKRLFIINTLIQSACISVLLFACTRMPEVDESEDKECWESSGSDFSFAKNGYNSNNIDGGFGDSSTTAESANMSTATHNQTMSFTHAFNMLNNSLSSLLSPTFLDMLTENATSGFSSAIEGIVEAFTRPTSTTAVASLEYADETATAASTISAAILDSVSGSGNSTDVDISSVVNLLPESATDFQVSDVRNLNSQPPGDIFVHKDLYVNEHSNTSFISSFTEPAKLDYAQNGTVNVVIVDYVTTRASATSVWNSSAPCSKTFILLRTELKKTQILENISFVELAQLTSYAQSVGMILGALLGSMMADIYGRRRLLYISLAGMLIFHCLLAVSISWIMFIFLRMVAVGCAGATLVISFVTVVEFVGPDWRDACTCSGLWTLGAILLSVETLVTVHWRWLALLSGGLCLPLIATFFTSTESLRWLQCQHRFTEAEWGFREIVSVNSAAVPDLTTLLDRSRGCIVNNMHSKKFTYTDLFHSLDSAKWTVALVYACTVSSTVYFSLLWRVKEITSVVYFDGFLPFVIDLPLMWSVVVMNRCLGRRWCLFLYAVASGFALLSVLILHITGNVDFLPSLVTGLALFGKIGVTASLSLILLIAIEMYPTVTRCMGVAVAVACASGGSMLFHALVFLERYHYTVPFVVYGLMMSSVGVLGLVFPETLRRPLKNVQQCRHRKIPLMEGARLVGRPPSLWDSV